MKFCIIFILVVLFTVLWTFVNAHESYSELSVYIPGGNRVVNKDKELTLSSVVNTDSTKLQYHWDLPFHGIEVNRSVLYFPPNFFTAQETESISYTFTLQVFSPDANTTASTFVIVYVVESGVLDISVAGIPDFSRMNYDDKLKLKAVTTSGHESELIFEWYIDKILLTVDTLESESNLLSHLSLQPLSQDYSGTYITVSLFVRSSNMAILPYILQLDNTIYINQLPSLESHIFKVEPSSGSALSTLFTISIEKNPSFDHSLTHNYLYSFSIVDEQLTGLNETYLFTSNPSNASSITTMLCEPMVRDDGRIYIEAKVYDEHGAHISYYFAVTVDRIPTVNDTEEAFFEYITGKAQQINNNTDTSIVSEEIVSRQIVVVMIQLKVLLVRQYMNRRVTADSHVTNIIQILLSNYYKFTAPAISSDQLLMRGYIIELLTLKTNTELYLAQLAINYLNEAVANQTVELFTDQVLKVSQFSWWNIDDAIQRYRNLPGAVTPQLENTIVNIESALLKKAFALRQPGDLPFQFSYMISDFLSVSYYLSTVDGRQFDITMNTLIIPSDFSSELEASSTSRIDTSMSSRWNIPYTSSIGKVVTQYLLSVTFNIDGNPLIVSNLSDRIELKFLRGGALEFNFDTTVKCVYWDKDINEWSISGIQTSYTTHNVVCSSKHTTAEYAILKPYVEFSVLPSDSSFNSTESEQEDEKRSMKALWIAILVIMLLIVAIIVTIMALYIIGKILRKRKNRKQPYEISSNSRRGSHSYRQDNEIEMYHVDDIEETEGL
jgi:hypothetical protein